MPEPESYYEKSKLIPTSELRDYAIQIADEMGIPNDLFLGKTRVESSWNPIAKNPDSSARGLNQFIDSTAAKYFDEPISKNGIDPNDPRYHPGKSMRAAASYLLDLKNQYGTWSEAVKHYYGSEVPGENDAYLRNVIKGSQDEVSEYQARETGKRPPGLYEEPPGMGTLIERMFDYLGAPRPRLSPREIAQAQIAVEAKDRGLTVPEYTGQSEFLDEFKLMTNRLVNTWSFGMTDQIEKFVTGEVKLPKTFAGTVGGEVLSLGGFFLGPYAGSRAIMGSRLIPTAQGIRGVAQIMNQGGATLGLATALNSIIPSYFESPTYTESVLSVFKSGVGGYLIGALFPLTGYVAPALPLKEALKAGAPEIGQYAGNKALQIAVGVAGMDMLRAGMEGGKGIFTIDDLYRGVADGTINKKELAHKSAAILMDLVFIARTGSMKSHLAEIAKRNPVVEEISKVSADEAEQAYMEITGQRQPPTPVGVEAKPEKPLSVEQAKKVTEIELEKYPKHDWEAIKAKFDKTVSEVPIEELKPFFEVAQDMARGKRLEVTLELPPKVPEPSVGEEGRSASNRISDRFSKIIQERDSGKERTPDVKIEEEHLFTIDALDRMRSAEHTLKAIDYARNRDDVEMIDAMIEKYEKILERTNEKLVNFDPKESPGPNAKKSLEMDIEDSNFWLGNLRAIRKRMRPIPQPPVEVREPEVGVTASEDRVFEAWKRGVRKNKADEIGAAKYIKDKFGLSEEDSLRQMGWNVKDIDPRILESWREYTSNPDLQAKYGELPLTPSAPVRGVEEPPAKGAKEAWEMTQGEHFKDSMGRVAWNKEQSIGFHKRQVEQALASGKPVPPGVLADYPDLAAKGAKEAWVKGKDFMDESPRYSLEGRDPATTLEDISVVITTEREPEFRGGPKVTRYYGTVRHNPTETQDGIGPFKSVAEAKKETEKLYVEYQDKFKPTPDLAAKGKREGAVESISETQATIFDKLGKQRTGNVGKLFDVIDKDEYSLQLRPDVSAGGYSVVINHKERGTRSIRFNYKGDMKLSDVEKDMQEYLDIDNKGRFRVEIDKGVLEKPTPVTTADKTWVGEWREQYNKYKNAKYRTQPQEKQMEVLQRRINADPAKWKEGDGVGWKVAGQTNRGFRIAEIDVENKAAKIIQVADTGLTTTGGDYDRIKPQWIPLGDLVRDNKYTGEIGKPTPDLAAKGKGEAQAQVSDEGAQRSLEGVKRGGVFEEPPAMVEGIIPDKEIFSAIKKSGVKYLDLSSSKLKVAEILTKGRDINISQAEAAIDNAIERGVITPKGKPIIKAIPPTTKIYGGGPETPPFFKGLFTRPVPPKVATTPEAKEVEAMYDRSREKLTEIKSGTWAKFVWKLRHSIYDVSANVKIALLKEAGGQFGDLGKRAEIAHDLTLGASNRAVERMKVFETDVYDGLPPTRKVLADQIIQSRAIIATATRRPDIKQPEGISIEKHQKYIEEALSSLGPDRKDMERRVNRYFELMRENLKEGYEDELFTKEVYDKLSPWDYERRMYEQHIDPNRTYYFKGNRINVPDSGIKSLEGGSEHTMETDSKLLAAGVVGITQSRIMNNRANRVAWEIATTLPDNGMFRVAKRVKIDPNEVTFSWEDAPPEYDMTAAEQKIVYKYEKLGPGETWLYVRLKGKEHRMIMKSEYAEEWVTKDPVLKPSTANIIGWLSGAKILRAAATGLNPAFAVRNLPRDIAHNWFVTQEYSINPIKAAKQFAEDYAAVWSDAVHMKGSWIDYVNDGGGMEWLTTQGKLAGKMEDISNYAGYVGTFSEIITRLAVRRRAMINGRTSEEATWIARTALDFGQGGAEIKALDTAFPYLNAGVSATRSVFRAILDDPKATMLKAPLWIPMVAAHKIATLGTIAAGLYVANSIWNKEAYDQVPNEVKVNSFVITTPFTYIDKTGDKRYLYFTIAKDQSQRIVSTLFEGFAAKMMGHDFDTDQIWQATKDFSAYIPTEKMPPIASAILGYAINKDFWRNRDIWRGPKVDPKEEFTEYTHPLAIKFGQTTGLSPDRMQYAFNQFIAPSNFFAGLVGAGLRRIMDTLPEKEREKSMNELIVGIPGLNSLVKPTDPMTPFKRSIDEFKMESTTKSYKQRRDFDTLLGDYHSGKTVEKLGKIRDFMQAQPEEDQQKLDRHAKEYAAFRTIPDSRWWRELKHAAPEVRAKAFLQRYDVATPAEKQQLRDQAMKLPGINTERFDEEIKKARLGATP